MQITHHTESYRAETEDRAAILGTALGPVLVVADGVGGQAGGGRASDLAVETLRETVGKVDITDPYAWYSCLRELDETLLRDDEAGQTTLVVVAVTPWRIVGASVGDSEAWLIQPEGHYPLTGGQNRKPYLGSGAEPVPFVLKRPSHGTLLVATDGLFKYAPEDRILSVALNPDLDGAAQGLADLARLPGGKLPDDLALLLCRWSDETALPFERVKNWFAPALRRGRGADREAT